MYILPHWPTRLLISLLAALPSVNSWGAIDWQIGRGRWSGALGMNYIQSGFSSGNDDRSVTGATQTLQETLGVQGNGLYVLDPRLVKVDLGLNLSHNQSNYSSLAEGSSSEGGTTDRVLGYNLDANILSNKPYPAKLYANRIQNQTSHNFGGLTVGTNENRGFSLQLKEDSLLNEWGGPWFSALLSASQQRSQSTTTYFERIFRSDQTYRSVAVSADKGFKTADLHFQYQAHQQSNALIEQPSNLSQNASLIYSLDFGPGLNRTFSSSLFYAASRTPEPFNILTASETLHIDHYQNLSTDTSYSLSREETGGIVSVSQDGSFSVSHTLFQNLSTSASLNGNQSNIPAGTMTFYSGQISQNYRHSLPGGGSLGLNWSGGYQRSSNALNSGAIPITREPHPAPAEFAPGFQLNKPFVMVDSIKVFNVKNGVHELLPASAYKILEEGNFVRIAPIYLDINDPNPLIKPDDKLEVEYTYQVDARLENETRDLGYGINVGYGWIAGGYQHQQTEQNPLTGESRFLSSSQTDNVNLGLRGVVLGLPLSVSASHSRGISRGFYGQVQEDFTRLSVESSGRAFGMDARGNASMDRFRGSRLGYDLRQLTATLLWRPDSTNWNMTFGANASSMHYLMPERQTSALAARASFNWDASGGWVNSAFAEVRSNDDSLLSRQTALRLGGRTSFRLGKLSLSSGVYFDHMTSGTSKANSQSFDVSVTRAFR